MKLFIYLQAKFLRRLRRFEVLSLGTIVALTGCSPQIIGLPRDFGVATHGGWSDLVAIGKKTDSSSNVLAQASILLKWNPMTSSQGAIQSWNIYRATAPGQQDFNSPLASGIAASTFQYLDQSGTGGVTYYYLVSPIVNGYPAKTPENYSEIKVAAPPDNMVLVHRWIANQEMCGLLGQTTDPTNNYRCPYQGPGGIAGYFDLGYSALMDMQEIGCNFSPAPQCGDVLNGCLGTSDPGAIGINGDVFYNRTSGVCFVKSTGIWKQANDPTLLSTERRGLASNRAHLPPLANMDQSRSSETCGALTELGYSGNKHLPSRKEQLLASAWSPQLTKAQISIIQNGINLPSTGNCNSNASSGLVFDNSTTPANRETLPFTLAAYNVGNGSSTVRTGSDATKNCVSRYGAQDLVGNVWEWNSDQLGSCNPATHTCTGVTSYLDPNNSDWNGFYFDGNEGPGGGAAEITDWAFSAKGFSSGQFLPPLGLPLQTTASSGFGGMTIGVGAGKFDPAQFNADFFWLHSDSPCCTANNSPAARGSMSGGSSNNGVGAGRFSLVLQFVPAQSFQWLGFRCALKAD